MTKTVEDVAENDGRRNNNNGDIFVDDDFVAHPNLEAGDDCKGTITEVSDDEIKVVETIKHADGSKTITETYEEVIDRKSVV